MTETTQSKTDVIRTLNDKLRQGQAPGGRIMITQGIRAAGDAFVRDVIAAVQSFEAFDADNDPYGEHDLGALTVEDRKIFFKIDYYDRALVAGSPDPADPRVTTRVLTIMLAEEY
jgi:hypothetical protein